MPISIAQHSPGTASSSTSYAVTLPSSGALTGELYFIALAVQGGSTLGTVSSGWTKLGQWANSTSVTLGVFYGLVGTAGALTVTNSAFTSSVYVGLRIKGEWSSQPVLAGASVTGSASTHTSAALTPSLGTRKYAWIAIDAVGNGGTSFKPTAAPSGWSNFLTQSDSGLAVTIGAADLLSTAGSQTPGNWGTATSLAAYVGNTFAVVEAPSAPRNPNNSNIVINQAALF